MICGLSLFWAGHPVTEAAESARYRFLKEAPRQWLEYRRIIARNTAGTLNCSLYSFVGERRLITQYKNTFVFNFDHKCVRLLSEVDNKNIGKVCNSKYRFDIRVGSDSKWILERIRMAGLWSVPDDLIGRHPVSPIIKGDNTTTFGAAMEAVCRGQMLWGGWFPLMVSSPEFRLVRVAYLEDNERLAKVEFEFEPTKSTGGNAPARSGMVVLDTERYWLIREAETQAMYSFGRGKLKVSNQLADGKLRVPYVSHQVMQLSCPRNTDGKEWGEEYVSDFDMYDAVIVDEKQFTLSAFGLPEPDQLHSRSEQSQSPSPAGLLWMHWFILTIVVICLTIFIRRYISRLYQTKGP